MDVVGAVVAGGGVAGVEGGGVHVVAAAHHGAVVVGVIRMPVLQRSKWTYKNEEGFFD